MTKRYWLLKTEPSVFSFDDLAKCPKRTTSWEGVRNYQARNLLRDEVKAGDLVLIYHSNADPPVAVGIAKVVRGAYPDACQFDRRSRYFDPKSDPAGPRWLSIDVQYDRPLARPVPLPELRATSELTAMALLRKGNRLSVQPVTAEEWKTILALGGLPPGLP
jgi:predicted RNA-binding protein with PUA-like domain